MLPTQLESTIFKRRVSSDFIIWRLSLKKSETNLKQIVNNMFIVVNWKLLEILFFLLYNIWFMSFCYLLQLIVYEMTNVDSWCYFFLHYHRFYAESLPTLAATPHWYFTSPPGIKFAYFLFCCTKCGKKINIDMCITHRNWHGIEREKW